MQITVFSIVMSIISTSILIAVLSILKVRFRIFEVNSVSVTLLLYVFCVIRMCFPVEFPWVIVIGSEHMYSNLYKLFQTKVSGFAGRDITLGFIGLLLWIIVAAILLLRLLRKYYAIYKLVKNVRDLNYGVLADDEKQIEGFQSDIKRKEKISVVKSNAVQAPICLGIIRKMILIPDREYSDQEHYYILKHEYTHHKNNDLLIQLLLNLLCIVYWWNPFVYLLKKDMLLAFEVRCDEMCVLGMDNKEITAYLETLLRVFKERENSALAFNEYLGVLGECSDGRGEIVDRFRILADRAKAPVKTRYGFLTVLLIVMIGILSYLFLLQPSIQPTEEDCGVVGEDYLIETNDSHILHKKNGEYVLITSRGETMVISEDTSKMMSDSGFEVIEE